MQMWLADQGVYHLAVGVAIVAAFWILTGVVRRALLALGHRVFCGRACGAGYAGQHDCGVRDSGGPSLPCRGPD